MRTGRADSIQQRLVSCAYKWRMASLLELDKFTPKVWVR
jgi:hypothetical protein